ncbi:FkbM family methyltransferase [Pelagibacterales bacterium SAG-MED16]|nr:FkbM family methyltransferase [Pelagibacterales bacterium SAG-MED16]|tara:strand:+ start:661 stop:1446 length:786 start_codon:yes stop_codon:yes gene_type:complete
MNNNFVLIFRFFYIFKLFKRIIPSILRKIGGFVTLDIFSFKMYLSLSDSIDREIFLTGYYDKDRFFFLQKYLTNNKFEYFFDIGSYKGFYSLFLYHEKLISNVFAFEANKKNYEILKKNIQLNKSKINIYNIALSDTRGEGKIWFSDSNKTGGSSVLNPEDNEISKYDKLKIIYESVKLDTLDSTFTNIIGKKILIKIDVERHEINVLKGSSNFIRNNKILLQVEVLENQKKTVFDYLIKNNFIYHYSIDDDHFFSNFIKV